VGTVLGVAKAYSTRVGEGPLPTELKDVTGDLLRRTGAEFGATTGRPRRCGWLDLAALRYTVRSGDVDALVITKLDVLDQLPEIQVCTHYVLGGKPIDVFPAVWEEGPQPSYRTMPGWRTNTSACRRLEDLPGPTRAYLDLIAEETGCPIAMVSVGKERQSTIRLDPWLHPSRKGGARVG
jgi:adenylosuccinate synthase